MATLQTVTFQNPTQGTLTHDTSASANTGVLRDSQGNILGAQIKGSELNSTGVLTLAVHATLTANATLDATAYVWPCDATGGVFTASLPPASTVTGRVYKLKRLNSGANAVTVAANGSDTIDGADTYSLAAQYSTVEIQSNGSGWNILSKF